MKNNQLFTELNAKESASVNGGLSYCPYVPPRPWWWPPIFRR
ncbi:hypothetical protein [Nostoc sp.]